MTDMPLQNGLIDFSFKNPVRFHMPGHKGKDFIPHLCTGLDVTELYDTDNLYSPSGIISEAEKKAADAFGADFTLFSAGGATLPIQSALCYAFSLKKKTGRPVFIDRLSHISVVNALTLLDAEPRWFFPEENESIARILSERPCALFLTSPDYYGRFRGEKLYSVCRSIDCKVICDNSHGSHLAFIDDGIRHPVKLGAFISIDSAHKTLPALTGAAFLHICGTKADRDQLLSYMRIFSSTSPSYLILSSLDSARAYMESQGNKKLSEIREYIRKARKSLEKVGFCFQSEELADIFRLTIMTSCIRIKGQELYDFLYERNIVCEFCDESNVICICTVADDPSMYDALVRECISFAEAFRNQNKYIPKESKASFQSRLPERVLSIKSAVFSETEELDIKSCENRVCASLYAPYPPGIPLVMPGERLSKEILTELSKHYDKIKIVKP